MNRTSLMLPVSLIVIGGGWLLSVLGFVPEIDWVWTIGLAAIGLSAFLIGGWNKLTCVTGPFFLVASLMSVLRQTGRIEPNVEVPSLVLALGMLMLLAHHPAVPVPEWAVEAKDE
ncbi:MAG: hypothetical protein KDA75_15670 [Planctomycetaceae bacterium]|nr:hypothetical protein [Planctomycetaceae bacterium]